MLVSYSQPLTATEVFNLGRFGEVSLSGAGRLYNPTAVAAPGAPAVAVGGAERPQPDHPRRRQQHPEQRPDALSAGRPVGHEHAARRRHAEPPRRGSWTSASRTTGSSRSERSSSSTRTHARQPRRPSAATSRSRRSTCSTTSTASAAAAVPDARAERTQFEFDRQEAKIVSALTAIDGDIVGLMEIENDGGAGNALAELVAALNAATGAGHLRVSRHRRDRDRRDQGRADLQAGALSPGRRVGHHHDRRRPAIHRHAEPAVARADLPAHLSSGQAITVAVNHLKSKGSDCGAVGDPDTGDGQGNCNGTRTAAAAALVDWLATDPTGSGDPDVLLIGDLNSYTFEDADHDARGRRLHEPRRASSTALDAYSYVFNGESGYLDHALATASLAAQVTGVTDWHINPDEPTVLDYNVDFKSPNQVNTFYDPGPYRASDHDPVIIGLQLNHAPTADAGGPYSVPEGSSVTRHRLRQRRGRGHAELRVGSRQRRRVRRRDRPERELLGRLDRRTRHADDSRAGDGRRGLDRGRGDRERDERALRRRRSTRPHRLSLASRSRSR